MSVKIRGEVSIDPRSVTKAIVTVEPLIPDGKVWKLVSSLFNMNISAGATVTNVPLNGVVSNASDQVTNLLGGLMTDEKSLVLAEFSGDETTAGFIGSYDGGIVGGVPLVDKVYLDTAFYVSLMCPTTDAGASTNVTMYFVLELEEVKVSTSIQRQILDSM